MGQTLYVPKAVGVAGDPTRKLYDLMTSDELTFLMEAHDGMSAAIAREAGFSALWASGLSISSALGYRDANEASWSDLVHAVVSRCP